MNNLSKTLLAGAALCALAAAPAFADSGFAPHVTALNGGRVVNKTKLHNHGATHVTYTFGLYDYVPASTPVGTKWTLVSQSFCPGPVKIKAPKKTTYGKISIHHQTYSNGCELVSATYKLVKQPSVGATDQFVLSAIYKFEQNGTKYKGTLNLDTTVEFD